MFNYDWLHYNALSDSVLHHMCIAVMEKVEKISTKLLEYLAIHSSITYLSYIITMKIVITLNYALQLCI